MTVNYTYDKNGNRLSASAVDNARAATVGSYDYVPDELNRLSMLTNVPAGQTYTFGYDALSRKTQVERPNGIRTTIMFSLASEIESVHHSLRPAGALLSSFAYTPDAVGNRATLTEQRPAFGIVDGVHEFSYDLLNQVTSATHPAIPPEVFNYDEVGNRNPASWVYDAANRLLEDDDFNYAYDRNGNMILKVLKIDPSQVTTFTHSPQHRLLGVELPDGTTVDYAYDGLGRRVQKTVSPPMGAASVRTYIYDNEDILLEYSAPGALVARYTHGPGIDEPLGMERDADLNGVFEVSEHFVYLADGLGSVTELVDSTGAVVQAYTYDSFGQVTAQVGTLENPYTFTGREGDADVGLHYYRMRYYDAKVGRFLEEDPLGFAGGDLNLYRYVGNNPVLFVDPFGLDREPVDSGSTDKEVFEVVGWTLAGVGVLIVTPPPVREVVGLVIIGVAVYQATAKTITKLNEFWLEMRKRGSGLETSR